MDNSLIDFAIGPVVAEALQRCGLTDTARRKSAMWRWKAQIMPRQ